MGIPQEAAGRASEAGINVRAKDAVANNSPAVDAGGIVDEKAGVALGAGAARSTFEAILNAGGAKGALVVLNVVVGCCNAISANCAPPLVDDVVAVAEVAVVDSVAGQAVGNGESAGEAAEVGDVAAL